MQPYILVPPQGGEPADEWMRLGLEAQVAGKLPDAQGYYQHALRLEPRHALATQNLAVVFAQSNLLNEALLTIERAAMFDGAHAVIRVNWALMALEADRIDEALRVGREALAMNACLETRLALAMILGTAGLADQAVPLYQAILRDTPAHPSAGPNAAFVQTLTNATPAELLAQRQQWYQTIRYPGPVASHGNDRTPDRCLRVGYVSGDFKRHSAAMIFGAVVNHHTPAVEPYLYSTLPVDEAADTVTKRFKTTAGPRWREIQGLTDEQAAAQIRADQIDILVDLAGHTNGGRLALFTRKPAPVQVTAWGFAHGTGLPEIDYFFADPVAVPEEERQHYAERVFDLPCVVTYEPPLEYNVKGVSPQPYFSKGYVTFGSYARYEKLSNACLATFGEILRQVPDSRLVLKDHGFRRPYAIRRVMEAMPDIAPERLLFAIATTHPEHLQAYQQADLMLDPFPHTGGVVGLEELWMGVPVVTLYGTQAAGRTTSSVLTAMGKTAWIAKSPEQYVEIAVGLVQDLRALGAARKTLREEFLASPVCVGYVEAVEVAYREIFARWCRA